MRPPRISKAEWRFLIGFDPDTDSLIKGPYHLKGEWALAPDEPGIYEIGLGTVDRFDVKYIGKAVRQSLRDRLKQHATDSSNRQVKAHSSIALFRCRAIDRSTSEKRGKEIKKILFRNPDVLIESIEGHFIVAFNDFYVWNQRNEWRQMASYDYSF